MMNKKPSTNPKFKSVSKVLDTGKTINDVQVLSDKYVTKRKTELFKRLKAGTIVKLLGKDNNTESIYNLADESEMLNNLTMNAYDNDAKTSSVYSVKTSNTQQTTTKTVVSAITYVTEMLGNLVSIN
jgi:hypothetical protein